MLSEIRARLRGKLGRFWRRRNTYVLLSVSVWSVMMGASFGMNLRLEQQAIVDLALAEARMAYQALTKINPSLMARQDHDLGISGNGIRGHITSLNPVSPKNRPDDWERNALKRLAAGAAETSEIRDIDGRSYFSLMRSLVIEQSCLQCHAGQGYQVGDIRGGLSVDVPMAPLWDAHRPHLRTMLAAYGLIWLMAWAPWRWRRTPSGGAPGNARRAKRSSATCSRARRWRITKSTGTA